MDMEIRSYRYSHFKMVFNDNEATGAGHGNKHIRTIAYNKAVGTLPAF